MVDEEKHVLSQVEGTVETEEVSITPENQPKPEEKAAESAVPEVKPDYIEKSKERNLRTLREQKESLERELAEERRKHAQPIQQSLVEEDDDFVIAPDELAEGKHLTKVAAKIKKMEARMQQYQQQSMASITETRLKTEYPDFDEVVSTEHIKELGAQYPELAQTIGANNDLYAKAVSAYTMIKKLGIGETYDKEKELVHKNIAKPRPLTSISPQTSESPLSRANAFEQELTEDRKKEIYKEMMSIIRNG